MAMMEEDNLQIDVEGTLRRRLPVALIAAGSVFLVAILLMGWLPNKYESWSTILVEPQAIHKRLVEAGVEDSDLNARLHLMTMQILSRAKLSKVIDEFGLYESDAHRMTREELILQMRDNIRVEPVLPELMTDQKSNRDVVINTFRLFFENEDAQASADVANRLANDFIDQHIKDRVSRTTQTLEFINQELSRLELEIAEVTEQIAHVKSENTGSLPEDMITNNHMLERILGDLRDAKRKYDDARSDQQYYEEQKLSNIWEAKTSQAESVTPEHRLQALQLQLGEYRSRGYTDKHPDIQKALSEIAGLRDRISAQKEADASGESIADEVKSAGQLQIEAAAKKAATEVASAKAEIERLQAETAGIEARIGATPRVKERLEGLEMAYEHLFLNYQDFANKKLDSEVAAQMERSQKGEQFRVLESAFLAPEPSFPNRIVILVLGVLLGGLVGVGLAFMVEVLDTSYHESRPLQDSFGFPVLASVPLVILESDRVTQRRKSAKLISASVAVTLLVCLASVGGYFFNNGLPGFLQGEEEVVIQEPPRSLLYGFLYDEK